MKNEISVKIVFKYCLVSFFSMLAFTMKYGTELESGIYISLLDYYIDRMLESFFVYQQNYYLLLPLFVCAYLFVDLKTNQLMKRTKILGFFFATMLVLGKSFRNTDSWDWVFLDGISFLKALVAVVGFYFVIKAILRIINQCFQTSILKTEEESEKKNFLSWFFNFKRSMPKTMLFVSAFIFFIWFPIIIISYPGGSCVDVSYQINQALGNIPFTTQHSILYTLYLKIMLYIGYEGFHSYNIGLFLAVVTQTCLLILSFSYSMYRLMEQKVKAKFLAVALFIYCLTPIYSNLATMAIKDTLFSAAILWFVIELVGLLFSMETFIKNKKRSFSFVLSAIFVTLLRNNGIYVIAFTIISLTIYMICKKMKTTTILFYCGIPIIGFLLISNLLVFCTNASSVTSKEILSIPFQQTARYMVENETDITEVEKKGLEAVFSDVKLLKIAYEPNISDPIKNLYKEDATKQDLIVYLKAWFTMGVRHPGIYVEAFINHSYGWFDLGANNWIRYQGRLPIFTTPKYLGTTDRAMYYLYNLLNRIPVLGFLENVAFYVWGMLFATDYLIRKKKKMLMIAFTPLYVSLLVCIASPAFWLHPRYALPIMLCMPFLWIILRVTTSKVEE